MIASIVGLIFIAGATLLRQQLPGHIQVECETKLNELFTGTGFRSEIEDVEFLEGQGIRISGIQLLNDGDTHPPKPILEIYNTFVHLPVSLTSLVADELKPELIEASGVRLMIERSADGEWNFSSLLAAINGLQGESDPVEVQLNDCEIHLSDLTRNPPLQIAVRDMSVTATPIEFEGREMVEIKGEFAGRNVSKVAFQGFFEPEAKRWYADVSADRFQLSPGLLSLVPDEIRDQEMTPATLNGSLSLKGRVEGNLTRPDSTRFEVDGTLRDFAISDQRLPCSVTRTNVDFSVTDRHLIVKRATGRADSGRFDFSYWQTGILSRGDWQCEGRVDNFDFTHRFHGWLPGKCDKFCHDFSPSGVSNIQFRAGTTGGEFHRDLRIEIVDMSMNWVKFPFPVSECKGQVTWIGDRFEFDLSTLERGQPMGMRGTIINPGPNATFDVTATASGPVDVNEKLFAAIEPYKTIHRAVTDFRPRGRISGTARLVKSDAYSDHVDRAFDVRLHQWQVRHRNFPYDVQNLNGEVKIRGKSATFEEIRGQNGTASVSCDGTWNEPQGLNLTFLCRDVPVDDNLRAAVSPSIRDVSDIFRPRGTIDLMRVDLTLPSGGEVDLKVAADLTGSRGAESVTINPTCFPYEMTDLTGHIEIGRGQIQLRDMRAQHGRTWLTWKADGSYSDEHWAVSFQDLFAGSLKVDRDLLDALPTSLSPSISQLRFEGQTNVRGTISLQGKIDPGPTPETSTQMAALNTEVARAGFYSDQTGSAGGAGRIPVTIAPAEFSAEDELEMEWNLSLDMNQAHMLIGLPVRNVFGSVQLAGAYNGLQAYCHGELAIDSLMLYDAQITGITGPILIDEQGVYAGALASPQNSAQARHLTGGLFDGMLTLDGRRLANTRGDFVLAATLGNGNLKDAVSEFAPQLEQINGSFFSSLQMQGDDSGWRSYRGTGNLSLRNAEIYELPVMLALLKILNIKEVNRTAFDTGNFDFVLNGDVLDFNRMELIGDAVSLIGNGQVDLSRRINLNFYSVMGRGRWYVPLVSELVKAGSQRALWITASGTLDDPKTDRKILPQLNDTIKNLLDGRPLEPVENVFDLPRPAAPLISELDPSGVPAGFNRSSLQQR